MRQVCMEICNKCGVSEAKRYLSDTKLEKSAQDSRLLAGGGGTLNFESSPSLTNENYCDYSALLHFTAMRSIHHGGDSCELQAQMSFRNVQHVMLDRHIDGLYTVVTT